MKKGFFLWAILLVVSLVAFPGMALATPPEAGALILPMIGIGGLLVNAASLTNVFINLKTTFNKMFDATPAMWQKIAMLVPSTGSQNDYSWLENFPKMRQWIGDKSIKNLKAGKYFLLNDDFEATVCVKRNHIEDDQLGIYAPQAENAGFSAKQWPDEMIMEVVNGAMVNLCFDGKPFFATDHPVVNPATGKPANVSNKGVAVLSHATLALAQGSYGAARTAMKKFKDDEGRPLNITPNVLLVGPALEDTARALLTNDKLEDGKPNPYKGTAELVVDSRITSDTAWYLLDTTKPVKPFIFQQRKAPMFVSQTDMASDNVFLRGEYNFGVEARGAAGYGFWQTAYGSTGLG